MKFFQYLENNQPKIGVKYQGTLLDFSRILKNYSRIPGGSCTGEESLLDLVISGLLDPGYINKLTNYIQSQDLEPYLVKNTIDYLPPVPGPERVIAIGRNYARHAEELGNPVPHNLVFFEKSITCLLPHLKPVIVPSWLEGRVDHEVELAIVLKKGGKNIPDHLSKEYIAGYSIFNDITARDLQTQDKKAGLPWFRSKSIDTFGPMGPFLVPAVFVENPHNLQIKLNVNAETRQRGNTKDMIYKVPNLVSTLSRYITLLPGDIIVTGTPAGVSQLKHGDVMEASITGLGTLKNPVIFEH